MIPPFWNDEGYPVPLYVKSMLYAIVFLQGGTFKKLSKCQNRLWTLDFKMVLRFWKTMRTFENELKIFALGYDHYPIQPKYRIWWF